MNAEQKRKMFAEKYPECTEDELNQLDFTPSKLEAAIDARDANAVLLYYDREEFADRINDIDCELAVEILAAGAGMNDYPPVWWLHICSHFKGRFGLEMTGAVAKLV